MELPAPILIADRFPILLDRLLALLEGLDDEDWSRPTVAAGWTVKDIAQHLLGDDVGILSSRRDGFSGGTFQAEGWEDLVDWINQQNGRWVEATRRISPVLLCSLLRFTGDQVSDLFRSLDPFQLGRPVSWAGPQLAPVWLDLAREFTERWHHQQHIRDAVGAPGLTDPYFLRPVLNAFVLALPRTFQQIQAAEGVSVTLSITGDAGGDWTVVREGPGWKLYQGRSAYPAAEVRLTEDTAWRLFTRGLTGDQARARASISGNPVLAAQLLETVSIIA